MNTKIILLFVILAIVGSAFAPRKRRGGIKLSAEGGRVSFCKKERDKN